MYIYASRPNLASASNGTKMFTRYESQFISSTTTMPALILVPRLHNNELQARFHIARPRIDFTDHSRAIQCRSIADKSTRAFKFRRFARLSAYRQSASLTASTRLSDQRRTGGYTNVALCSACLATFYPRKIYCRTRRN